jgi:hypothetical protein
MSELAQARNVLKQINDKDLSSQKRSRDILMSLL